MVTRRAMLKGTAAGSIAAIASAHGVAASAAGVGYGDLEGGAMGVFQKVRGGFSVFFKFFKSGAEVFYKVREEQNAVAVDIFYKFFDKARGWGAFVKYDTLEGANLEDASVGFYKLESDVAGIFLKIRGHDDYNLDFDADGLLEPDGAGTIG